MDSNSNSWFRSKFMKVQRPLKLYVSLPVSTYLSFINGRPNPSPPGCPFGVITEMETNFLGFFGIENEGVIFRTKCLFCFDYPVRTPEGWSETPFMLCMLSCKIFFINYNILHAIQNLSLERERELKGLLFHVELSN